MRYRPLMGARYDRIGVGYARTRREDPALAALIGSSLGDAVSVVNVGAGTGSYEPTDRRVIAVEPSAVMAAQRDPARPVALRAGAAALPLHDQSVDAAMAVLTLHHWGAGQRQGVAELRRVARGPVVIVTFDPRVSAEMWLARDYLPEVAARDRVEFPEITDIVDWLGGDVQVVEVEIGADTPDWTFAAFWAHPERVSDPLARAATSAFARLPGAVQARAVAAVAADLNSGEWDRRYGRLRSLSAYDAGLRLLCAPG